VRSGGQYLVVDLGRFGEAMVETLVSLGHEVVGVDSDREIVQELSVAYPSMHLAVADATDEAVLRELSAERSTRRWSRSGGTCRAASLRPPL